MPPSFVPHRRPPAGKRSLDDIPFVELHGGRVQGVVSSGSDIERVYVSWFAANGDHGCSTNNNRPCGGLRGSPCKHIVGLIDAAYAQFGADEVARHLALTGVGSPRELLAQVHGAERKEPTGPVFARFLDYLGYMAAPPPTGELPELDWFVTG